MSCWTGFYLLFLPSLRFYASVAVYCLARQTRVLYNIQQVGCDSTLTFSYFAVIFTVMIFILPGHSIHLQTILKNRTLTKTESSGELSGNLHFKEYQLILIIMQVWKTLSYNIGHQKELYHILGNFLLQMTENPP